MTREASILTLAEKGIGEGEEAYSAQWRLVETFRPEDVASAMRVIQAARELKTRFRLWHEEARLTPMDLRELAAALKQWDGDNG